MNLYWFYGQHFPNDSSPPQIPFDIFYTPLLPNSKIEINGEPLLMWHFKCFFFSVCVFFFIFCRLTSSFSWLKWCKNVTQFTYDIRKNEGVCRKKNEKIKKNRITLGEEQQLLVHSWHFVIYDFVSRFSFFFCCQFPVPYR